MESGVALDQKDFAVKHLAGVEPMVRALAFRVRKGSAPLDAVRDFIAKSTNSCQSSQTKVSAERCREGQFDKAGLTVREPGEFLFAGAL